MPSLVDVIPEARLNLVIYYLRQGNIEEAYELMRDVDPSTPNEYILKGIVFAAVGQEQNSVSYTYYQSLCVYVNDGLIFF